MKIYHTLSHHNNGNICLMVSHVYKTSSHILKIIVYVSQCHSEIKKKKFKKINVMIHVSYGKLKYLSLLSCMLRPLLMDDRVSYVS